MILGSATTLIKKRSNVSISDNVTVRPNIISSQVLNMLTHFLFKLFLNRTAVCVAIDLKRIKSSVKIQHLRLNETFKKVKQEGLLKIIKNWCHSTWGRCRKILQLTIVKRPSASRDFSIGNVTSRKISSRLLNDETESSKRPRPSWSFEQSRRIMGGFWLYCKA